MRPSTVLTATRCIQVPKELSPRNRSSLLHAWMKASCVQSSASAGFPVMRRHRAYTRSTCNLYSDSNADESDVCARSIQADSSLDDSTVTGASTQVSRAEAALHACNAWISTFSGTLMYAGSQRFEGDARALRIGAPDH